MLVVRHGALARVLVGVVTERGDLGLAEHSIRQILATSFLSVGLRLAGRVEDYVLIVILIYDQT